MERRNLETRTLGKTGLKATRLSAGGHFTMGPSSHQDLKRRVRELHRLVDAGVTYFDVQWEPEEEAMAEVLKTRRDEIAVGWPLHGATQRGEELRADYILDYCADHRRRFGVDGLDCLFWIELELDGQSEERVMDEARRAFEKLKADGFCRSVGFSCHYAPDMVEHVLDKFDAHFDACMVPYSPLHPAAGRGLLDKIREKGLGAITMKPFGGGRGFHGMVWSGEVSTPEIAKWRGSARPFQAALRWVLRDERVDCVIPGLHSAEQIDQALEAATTPFTAEDQEILDALVRALAETQPDVQLHWDNIKNRNAWD